jgi:hypothetical protein
MKSLVNPFFEKTKKIFLEEKMRLTQTLDGIVALILFRQALPNNHAYHMIHIS